MRDPKDILQKLKDGEVVVTSTGDEYITLQSVDAQGKTKGTNVRSQEYVIKVSDFLAGANLAGTNPNVPIKTYCAEILQLGIGTAPQVNAVIVNTFDGVVAPAQLLNFAVENGFIRIESLDSEFTIGKTMVTITPSETNAGGVNCFVQSITDQRVNILCQDISNNLADKNNVQILVKIEVYA